MAIDVEAPECLAQPIQVPSKILMGAGPSNAADSVLKTGELPLLGHLHAEFTKVRLYKYPFLNGNFKADL